VSVIAIVIVKTQPVIVIVIANVFVIAILPVIVKTKLQQKIVNAIVLVIATVIVIVDFVKLVRPVQLVVSSQAQCVNHLINRMIVLN
jgi:hypothetical protein